MFNQGKNCPNQNQNRDDTNSFDISQNSKPNSDYPNSDYGSPQTRVVLRLG